jgi:pimeloyl-ACP methyl ester carboxylesterase
MSAITAGLPIPGFRSETVTVAGVRLHHWVGGAPEGRPVILWHGFLSTGYAWREVAALAQAGMAVLVPDMRGFGDSDKPEGNEGYDARALSEECRALVAMVTETVQAHTLSNCGHFITEERPEEVTRHILAIAAKTANPAS